MWFSLMVWYTLKSLKMSAKIQHFYDMNYTTTNFIALLYSVAAGSQLFTYSQQIKQQKTYFDSRQF